jgi:hypothetical protein
MMHQMPPKHYPTYPRGIEWGWTEIHWLSSSRDDGATAELATLLARPGVNPDEQTGGRDPIFYRTPAFLVAYYVDKPERLALFSRESLSWSDRLGRTLMNQAAFYDHPESVSWLARQVPATLNGRAQNGETPLHAAVSNQSARAVAALLASGADATLRSNAGRTPRELALLLHFGGIARLFGEVGLAPAAGRAVAAQGPVLPGAAVLVPAAPAPVVAPVVAPAAAVAAEGPDLRKLWLGPAMPREEIERVFAPFGELGVEYLPRFRFCFLHFVDPEAAQAVAARGSFRSRAGLHKVRRDDGHHPAHGALEHVAARLSGAG